MIEIGIGHLIRRLHLSKTRSSLVPFSLARPGHASGSHAAAPRRSKGLWPLKCNAIWLEFELNFIDFCPFSLKSIHFPLNFIEFLWVSLRIYGVFSLDCVVQTLRMMTGAAWDEPLSPKQLELQRHITEALKINEKRLKNHWKSLKIMKKEHEKTWDVNRF